MWAYQLVRPYTFERIEVSEPKESDLVEGQVILQIRAGSVCGSDTPLFRGSATPNTNVAESIRFAPAAIGAPCHEVVGDVIATKSDLKVGQRVVGWAQNGLVEQIIGDTRSLIEVNSTDNPADQAPIQPLACVLHALDRIGKIEGKRAAVIGLGPIGLLFCHALRARGAVNVIGVDRIDRSAVAKQFGIDELAITPSDRWAYEMRGRKERPDIVIEAVGHQVATLNHAIDAAADEGCVFHFGVADDFMFPVAIQSMQRKDLTLYSGTTPHSYRKHALARARDYLLADPELTQLLISHRFDVTDAQKAYECAERFAPDRIKVVMSWN